MRNNDPLFWPADDIDLSLRQNREKNYTDCINILQTQWYHADLDQRFAMGDQDLWGLIFPGVATYRRKIFNFNIINSLIQMVTGYQRRNRKTTICIPLTNALQKTSDQFTKCQFYVHRHGLYQTYSEAFERGALTQGVGLVSFYKDMTEDPISGEIKGRYVDFKSVLIDPYFRNADLSDCRFIWTRQFFGRDEAARFYPQFSDKILSLPSGSYRDEKFYYMPEVYQIQYPNVLAIDEYWYLSDREATFLVDTVTNEVQEYSGAKDQMPDILRTFKNRLKFVEKRKQTTRRTLTINDRALVDEPNPYGLDRYPHAACLGYFNPDTPYYNLKFRGIVRDLRDPQYLFNRRKVADLDIIEAQQQGLKIRQGALVTPDDAFNQGNGRALFYKKDGSPDDIIPMPIIPPAPQLLEMEEMLKQVMHQISGISPEMMGQEIDDKAGLITMLRQAAGTNNLTKLFDQFDDFQRQCGEIIIEMIQKNWTYGKVKQVINEEPTAEFDNKAFFKYGCKVIQGSMTESQQQMQLQQLLYFREVTGIPIPSKVILEASTLQNKDDLMEAVMEAEQQAMQQQQKMEQLQMQQIQVDTQTKLSYAEAEKGLARERVAKIETDRAVATDKIRRAHQEDTKSILNVIQAVKELQSIDISQMTKQIELIKAMQEATSVKEPDLAKESAAV